MARVVANTKEMPREQWLQLRKEGVGGSDAAAVVGVSKYATPLTVFMEKRGLYTREVPASVSEAAEWGNIMESVLRDQFKRRINAERAEQGLKPLWIQQRHSLFAHDTFDFMRTNLDGQILGHELGPGILEIKTGSEYTKDEWDGDDVPNAYYLQVQHNIKVMEAEFAYLVVLIGGNKYKHYFIPRDEETINSLVALEHDFWHNYVCTGIPPEMSGAAAEKEMLNGQYPQSEGREGDITTLPIACIEMAEKVDAYRKLGDELKTLRTKYENEIKAIMGTTEMAFAGSHKVTWKTDSRGVRSLKIKLDSQDDRNKFYEKKRKEIEKEAKAIEKERKEIEKAAEKQRKADEKARKEAEKAAKEVLKAEKLALKLAQQQPVEPEQLEGGA